MRVLIVDDNVALAENIAEVLEFDGHTIDVAGSAEEAMPKAHHHLPDMIITDYRLPGMNGAEFLRRFRARNNLPHAVVKSDYTDEGTVGEAKEAGATFGAKPIDFDLLCRLVREGRA